MGTNGRSGDFRTAFLCENEVMFFFFFTNFHGSGEFYEIGTTLVSLGNICTLAQPVIIQ